MKKQGFILLALVVMVTLTACGGPGAESSSAAGSAGAGAGSVVAAPFAEVIGGMDDQGRTVVYTNVDKKEALTVDSKANLVDDKGKTILSTDFRDLRPIFGSDEALYKRGSEQGILNTSGQVVRTLEIDGALQPASILNGLPVSYEKDGRWGLLDKDFKVLREPFSDQAVVMVSSEQKGQSYGLYDEKRRIGLLNAKGDLVRKPFADEIGAFTRDGYAVYKDGDHGGIVDVNGKDIKVPKNQGIENFNELGYAAFQQDGAWGLLDEKGKLVLKPTYAELRLFNKAPLAWFKEKPKDKWGIVALK